MTASNGAGRASKWSDTRLVVCAFQSEAGSIISAASPNGRRRGGSAGTVRGEKTPGVRQPYFVDLLRLIPHLWMYNVERHRGPRELAAHRFTAQPVCVVGVIGPRRKQSPNCAELERYVELLHGKGDADLWRRNWRCEPCNGMIYHEQSTRAIKESYWQWGEERGWSSGKVCKVPVQPRG